MRFVSRNTPFVVRHGAANWTAVQQWSPVSLKSALSGQTVNVAVTPYGYVDLSLIRLPSARAETREYVCASVCAISRTRIA